MVHSLANTVLCKSTVTIIIQSIRKTKQSNVQLVFVFLSKKKKEIEFTPNTWSLIITIEFHDSVPTTKNLTVIFLWSDQCTETWTSFPVLKLNIFMLVYIWYVTNRYIFHFHPSCLTSRKTDHEITISQMTITISCSLFHEQKRMI